MYNENYLRWAQQADIPPLTRTQKEFADFLINNYREIIKIGDLEPVFRSIRNWMKFSDAFNPDDNEPWVEHVLKPETVPADEWEGVGNAGAFDWGMSMRDLEKRYNNKKHSKKQHKMDSGSKKKFNDMLAFEEEPYSRNQRPSTVDTEV